MSSTTLNTMTTTTLNFSFYMIDQTHAVMVETDSTVTTPLLFGQIYSAPAKSHGFGQWNRLYRGRQLRRK